MANAFGRPLRAATWVLGDSDDPLLDWTRAEIATLTQALCGASARFSRNVTEQSFVLVGTPETNPLIRQAISSGRLTLDGVEPDGYVIKPIELAGVAGIAIAGDELRAAVYGVFDLFEQMGCTFLLTHDVLPEPDPEVLLPSCDVRRNSAQTWRGIFLPFCWPGFILSVQDITRLLDQMVQLRLNSFLSYHFENEPFRATDPAATWLRISGTIPRRGTRPAHEGSRQMVCRHDGAADGHTARCCGEHQALL